jgi:glycine C-acetyltransferase
MFAQKGTLFRDRGDMNLRPYLYVVIPVLLWSMQTTSTRWFLAAGYSGVEVALYRSIGAILFAVAVAGTTAYKGFQAKQFVPGVCLALNFVFFNLALAIAIRGKDTLFGPLLMTVEASNFIFCLPILWALRKPAQVAVAALVFYVLGMAALGFGALQNNTQFYGWELACALLTSFTFALFNCTVDFAGKGNNRSVALMLPIVALNLAWVLVEPHVASTSSAAEISSVRDWMTRVWRWQTPGLLFGVGLVQTGAAYFFWSKAAQRFSSLTLSLSFLWTVPIAYLVTLAAEPIFTKSFLVPTQSIHDIRVTDGLAVCFLIAAFVCDNRNILSGWGKIVLRDPRSTESVLIGLDETLRKLESVKIPKVQGIRSSVCIEVDGHEMANYATSDYLGLAGDLELRRIAAKAIQDSGWGLSSARPSGTQDIHNRAETVLSRFLGAEDAVLFSSAYAANLAAFEWLSSNSVILYDELCHGSSKDGIRLSKADPLAFRHLDLEHLEDQLNRRDVRDSESVLIVTDGVFSSSGEIADLKKIADLAKKYNCLVAVDDTHGTGVLGANGVGTHELQNCVDSMDVIITSLAKALGCPYGGVLAGRRQIVRHVRALGHSYQFSNAVSPVIAATAIKAVEMLRRDCAKRDQLFSNLSLLRARLPEVENIRHPMFGIRFNDAPDNRSAAEFVYTNLIKGDILPAILEPPYTATQSYSVRIQLSALHTEKQILNLVEHLTLTMGTLAKSYYLRAGQVSTVPAGLGWRF